MDTLLALSDIQNQVDDPNMPRNISNSEVSAWLACQRKYYYTFDLNLEPVKLGTALSRGVLGHEALAEYYTVLQEHAGQPGVYEEARRAARRVLTTALASASSYDDEMVGGLAALLDRYFEYAERTQRDWKILAVEKKYDIPVNEDYAFTMRLDLAARIDGKVTVVDHKFVYDFWSTDDLALNPQIPKYIGALRFNGITVDRGMVNQLRYRMKKAPMTDDELFRYDYMYPTDVEIRTIMREQFRVSQQIVNHRKQGLEERSKNVFRVMNKMGCKNCSVLSLCKAELMGNDITYDIQNNYQQNSYSDRNQIDEDKGSF